MVDPLAPDVTNMELTPDWPLPLPALLFSWPWEQDGLSLGLPTCAPLLRAALAVAQDYGRAKLRYGWDLEEYRTKSEDRGGAAPSLGPHDPPSPADEFYSEAQAKMFLQFYEQTARVVLNELMEATWNYVTNITKQNQENMVWYHFPQGPPSPSLFFLGILEVGDHSSCPISRMYGKKDTPKTYVKVGCKS